MLISDAKLTSLDIAVKEGILTQFECVSIKRDIDKFKAIYVQGDKKSRKIAKKNLEKIRKKVYKIEDRLKTVKPRDVYVAFYKDIARVMCYYFVEEPLYHRKRMDALADRIEFTDAFTDMLMAKVMGEYEAEKEKVRKLKERLTVAGMLPCFSKEWTDYAMEVYEEISEIASGLEIYHSACDKPRLYAEVNRIRDRKLEKLYGNKYTKVKKLPLRSVAKYEAHDSCLKYDVSFLVSCICSERVMAEHEAKAKIPSEVKKQMKSSLKKLDKFLIFLEDQLRSV